jgi:hypothetical protein
LEIKTTKGFTILPINNLIDYLNIYNQNEYQIKKVIQKNDKIYVLVSLAFTVCGAIKTRGSGCGGHDVFLRLSGFELLPILYHCLSCFSMSFSVTPFLPSHSFRFLPFDATYGHRPCRIGQSSR